MRAFGELRAKPRALTGGMRYIESPRHAFYVQFEDYLKELDRARTRVERARELAPTRRGTRPA